MTSLKDLKNHLRAEALGRRDALDPGWRVEASLRAGELGAPAIRFDPGTIVSGFLPIRSEIDLRPLMAALADKGARLCLPVVLDRETHRVYRSDSEIKLGPTEFRLLEFMMRHPGRVFSRSQLLDNVWGETIYIDERTVDVHVGRLRKAVNNGRMPDVIRTIRGAGYAIRED